MKTHVKWVSDEICEVTVTPSWLGQLFGRAPRKGLVQRGIGMAEDTGERFVGYFWRGTGEFVGNNVMRLIEEAREHAHLS